MTNRTQKIVIVLVVIGVCVLFVLGIFAGAAVIGWKAATRASNEAATVQNLKTIQAVEVLYFNTHKRTFGTIDQLIAEQMLSSKFAGHPTVADGYVFDLSVVQRLDGSSSYKVTTDPQDESAGTKHFYLDSDDGRIRVNSEHQAGPGDVLF